MDPLASLDDTGTNKYSMVDNLLMREKRLVPKFTILQIWQPVIFNGTAPNSRVRFGSKIRIEPKTHINFD